MAIDLNALNRLRHICTLASRGPRRVAKVQQVGRSRRFTVPDRREFEQVLCQVPGVGVVLVEPPGGVSPSADADHIAAFDRDTCVTLLNRVEEQAAQIVTLRRLAKEATNALACVARAKYQHDEVARLHLEIDAVGQREDQG